MGSRNWANGRGNIFDGLGRALIGQFEGLAVFDAGTVGLRRSSSGSSPVASLNRGLLESVRQSAKAPPVFC